MIRINQIKLPVHHTKKQLEQKIVKILKISAGQPFEYQIVKKSIDARKKPDLRYVYSVEVTIEDEGRILKKVDNNNVMSTKDEKYRLPDIDNVRCETQSVRVSAGQASAFCAERMMSKELRPVVVGAGPAGLFCAYVLALKGLRPIVVERGKCMEERTKDVERFWESGVLDTASNVQFGEGGAGTFSDGKLNTLVKDAFGRNRFVLDTFVKFGAPEEICYENKPHIGTDVLAKVIQNMRKAMETFGAEFLFETCMTDYRISDGKITAIELNHTQWLDTDCCVLAIGHSARDTFRMLFEKQQLAMEAKSFAVGFRVEHPQEEINLIQYGETYYKELPAAPYKVSANRKDGRGVYSFCMCPGGYVVNASSNEHGLAVNGMSYSGRNGNNANSAIIVSVDPSDFDGTDALAGIRFQERLEEKAYALGNGKIPQQLFGDFCENRASVSYGNFESETKGAHVLCNLRGLLPEELETSFVDGMHLFAHSIQGFDREDAILSGVESRTSSPVRITRNESLMSEIRGIYPCGEGAGYAGGIMSAAMDGLKVAEAILKQDFM